MTERQRIANLLRNCSRKTLLDQGIQIHGALVKMGFEFDLIIRNDLIDMYSRCLKIGRAHQVFDEMPDRNVVSWTALMGGHLQQGNAKESLTLFHQMGFSGIKPNEFTFSMNLKACSFLGIPENGAQIHTQCVKSGFDEYPVVGNSIIDMYSKSGKIDEAEKQFDKMPRKNLISWNAMITGYTHEGHGRDSLCLFRKMLKNGETPDEFTFASLLKACSALSAIYEGTQIHATLITNGFTISVQTIMASALVDLYVKCQRLTEARQLFDRIIQKNVISWTAMIMGYAQGGSLKEAVDLFIEFRKTGIQIDGFILSSIVGLFADFALAVQGKQIHSYTVKIPSGSDVSVANSIVDMYLNCGFIEEAKRRFDEVSNKNVVSWTVLITGYGKHGDGKEATRLFEVMQLEKIEPDEVTYLAVLSACSHAGLVEESHKYFSRLLYDDRMKPKLEHYACIVDVLGRKGRLKEAKDLIETMNLTSSASIWQTLLGACRIHKDFEMSREVGEILLRLDGEDPVNYVMMSNIYAEKGEWRECERLRVMMKKRGLKKEAGCSWIEIDKEVHCFYGGDDSHPIIEKVHGVLKLMEKRMKEESGYVVRHGYSMHDVEEESKEESLRVHSEKLAIGLGLVCWGLEGGGVIRVFKNLRVCGDCHEFIKGLSRVLKWVFLVRDANRFHRFECGACSCGDYW